MNNASISRSNRLSAKKSIWRQPEQFLPTSVRKSYFTLPDAERAVLNTALEKHQPGQLEPNIAQINAKTDLNIALKSLEKAEHSPVTALMFAIKARTVSKGKPSAARPISTSVP